jgi:hypothetical protein
MTIRVLKLLDNPFASLGGHHCNVSLLRNPKLVLISSFCGQGDALAFLDSTWLQIVLHDIGWVDYIAWPPEKRVHRTPTPAREPPV